MKEEERDENQEGKHRKNDFTGQYFTRYTKNAKRKRDVVNDVE